MENIKLNKLNNVICLNIAAWHRDEELDLFYAPHAGENTLKKNYGLGYEKVKARALDCVLKEMGIISVDLIKIDVEGSEYEVLKGLTETLKNCNPKVIIEILDEHENQIIRFMSKLGYTGREVMRGEGTQGRCSYFVFEKISEWI